MKHGKWKGGRDRPVVSLALSVAGFAPTFRFSGLGLQCQHRARGGATTLQTLPSGLCCRRGCAQTERMGWALLWAPSPAFLHPELMCSFVQAWGGGGGPLEHRPVEWRRTLGTPGMELRGVKGERPSCWVLQGPGARCPGSAAWRIGISRRGRPTQPNTNHSLIKGRLWDRAGT